METRDTMEVKEMRSVKKTQEIEVTETVMKEKRMPLRPTGFE